MLGNFRSYWSSSKKLFLKFLSVFFLVIGSFLLRFKRKICSETTSSVCSFLVWRMEGFFNIPTLFFFNNFPIEWLFDEMSLRRICFLGKWSICIVLEVIKIINSINNCMRKNLNFYFLNLIYIHCELDISNIKIDVSLNLRIVLF